MRHRVRPLFPSFLALLPVLATALPAQAPPPATAPVAATFDVSADRMSWWREARFGLVVHWGLYAVLEGEWQGKSDYGEWILHSANIPRDEYDALCSRFTVE